MQLCHAIGVGRPHAVVGRRCCAHTRSCPRRSRGLAPRGGQSLVPQGVWCGRCDSRRIAQGAVTPAAWPIVPLRSDVVAVVQMSNHGVVAKVVVCQGHARRGRWPYGGAAGAPDGASLIPDHTLRTVLGSRGVALWHHLTPDVDPELHDHRWCKQRRSHRERGKVAKH